MRACPIALRRLALTALVALLPLLHAAAAHAQYAVGTADVTYVDAARGNRPVPVNLYYPATVAGANQPVAAPPAGGFASVAFGHGFQMTAGVYAWIAERLASLGCVVAVPRTGGELFPSHEQFGLDLAFAARTLRDAGASATSPFFGRMGPRTLVMGHSMGGGCSLLAAAGDPSLTAVANFAAAETTPSAVAVCGLIGRPALLFSGTNDCVTPPAAHQIPMYEALAGWRVRVTLDGASHCQFNASSFLCSLGETCSAGITRQQQQDLTWSVLQPWVRAVLFLDPAAAREFAAVLAAGAGFTVTQTGGAASVDHDAPPRAMALAAVPNPFNPTTELLAEVAGGGSARLEIFDPRGHLVRTLTSEPLTGGLHRLRWDGRDDGGREVPSGAYLARLSGAGGSASAKLMLLR